MRGTGPGRTGPRLVAVGSATPPTSYTQQELLEIFRVEDPRIRSLFLNGGIQRRYLTLPPELPDGTRLAETQGDLLAKHLTSGVSIGTEAVQKCLKEARADVGDIGYYDWDERHGRFSFFLDQDIPYVVGAHAEQAVGRLLAQAGLRRSDIDHWVIHSGGKKVIDAVRINLGLTRHDTRHTTDVLRDCGNLSSGAFLFSYQRLLEEAVVAPGDNGVLMTMGPGSTIETALLRW